MAVLHEIIAAGNARLSAALSPQVASEFAGIVATETLRHLGFDKEPDGGFASVKKMMDDLGMKLAMNRIGEELQCSITCPFAKEIHPLLANKTVCPIAILMLGVERSKRDGVLIDKLLLTDDGADAVIGPNRFRR